MMITTCARQETWAAHLAEHRRTLDRTEAGLSDRFAAAADLLIATLRGGGTVFFCGNGGSAADAQHLAAEFTVRFTVDRRPFRAMTLAADASAMTACGNDLGFERIFARQLEALGRRGDALVAITTSGNSDNVLAALRTARQLGLASVAMTGETGGRAAALADVLLAVPSATTAAIQEMHITIGHALCHVVEAEGRS